MALPTGGVPLIAPDDGSTVIRLGNEPAVTAKVTKPVAPVVTKGGVEEYRVSTSGTGVPVTGTKIAKGGGGAPEFTVIWKCWLGNPALISVMV